MIGPWISLVGAIIGFIAVSPPLMRHPHRAYLPLRLLVGGFMLVDFAGMAVYLVKKEWAFMFVTGSLSATLGYAGGSLLVSLLETRERQTAKKRKKARQQAGPLDVYLYGWVAALVVLVGAGVTIVEGV